MAGSLSNQRGLWLLDRGLMFLESLTRYGVREGDVSLDWLEIRGLAWGARKPVVGWRGCLIQISLTCLLSNPKTRKLITESST